jgi:hypothetical protein
MHIRRIALIAALACTTFPLSRAQEKRGLNPTARNLDQWSDADITTWMHSALDRGLPDELDDYMSAPMKYRGAIVVPLTEQKIEEILRSTSPATCFTDPAVDPGKFVREAVAVITGAGDEDALKAASQLMKIDEARFGWMVGNILFNGMGYRNPFTVAYRGFAIGDPLIDSRIAVWTEAQLSQNHQSTQQDWAEAMLDRYSVVPNADQWATDPIASRLSPKVLNLIRSNVTRLAAETIEKRMKG